MSARPSPLRHPFRYAVTLAAAVGLLLLAVVATAGLVGSSGLWFAAGPDAAVVLARARVLLDARAAAVLGRDETAYRALISDPTTGPGAALMAQFRVLGALPFSAFKAGHLAVVGTEGGGWQVEVDTVHAYDGVDTGARVSREVVTVHEVAGRWRFADQRAVDGEAVLWSAPGAVVFKGRHSVVLGTVDTGTARVRAAQADRGAEMAAVAWPGHAVTPVAVLAPATSAQWTALQATGGAPAGGAPAGSAPTAGPDVAAMTEGPLDAEGHALADRIVLNPDALARVTTAGQEFVVAHECVHARLRVSLGGELPVWLSEGFADWVAYRPTGLTDQQVTGALRDSLRSGAGPNRWPSAADFAGDNPQLEVSHEASWLIVSMLAAEHGEGALRDFVRASAVAAPFSLNGTSAPAGDAQAEARADRAFGSALGTTREAVRRSWLARLDRLAAS